MDKVTGNFRSKLFGGFDRSDVTSYIEKLATERNRYKKETEKHSETIEELNGRIDLLEERISALSEALDAAEAEARTAKESEEEYRRSALSQAESAVGKLKEKYEVLREEIVTAAVRLRTEMCDSGEKITGLAAQLETAEEVFSPLNQVLNGGAQTEYGSDMMTESDGEDTFQDAYAQNQAGMDMLKESDGEDSHHNIADREMTDAEPLLESNISSIFGGGYTQSFEGSEALQEGEDLLGDKYARLQMDENAFSENDGEDFGGREISFQDLRKKYPEVKWEQHDE